MVAGGAAGASASAGGTSPSVRVVGLVGPAAGASASESVFGPLLPESHQWYL